MALYKEITDDKGINLNYFRISKVELEPSKNKLKIEVKEYTHKAYREKEKEVENLLVEIQNKQQKINVLSNNPLENEEEITKIKENIEKLTDEYNQKFDNDLSVKTTNYYFDLEDKEYSLTICYDMLKTLEIFKNSSNA